MPIDQTDRNDVLAVIRESFSQNGPRDREQAVHDIALALGYGRLGPRIREVLGNDLRTAVRRGILDSTGSRYALLCRHIDEYTLDHLVSTFLAAMGPGWWIRSEAVIAAARHLGYRRTGRKIAAAFKSAVNAGIRRGLIERDGADWIRRALTVAIPGRDSWLRQSGRDHGRHGKKKTLMVCRAVEAVSAFVSRVHSDQCALVSVRAFAG